MTSLRLQCNAKVNLALDILGRAPAASRGASTAAGYHFIQTVLHEITPQNTHDFKPDFITIEVEKTPRTRPKPGINIVCSNPSVPAGRANLVCKAVDAILICDPVRARKTKPAKITITIEKNIPVSRGLGGGSSNAAAVLKGLNELLGLNLSLNELKFLAAGIGMDVPFFIEGGTAIGEHFGEQITRLPPVDGLAFTIFPDPSHQLRGPDKSHEKTKKAYAAIDLSLCGKNIAKTEQLVHAIKTNDSFSVHSLLHNDFETLLPGPLPENHHLTGSGPAQFIVA